MDVSSLNGDEFTKYFGISRVLNNSLKYKFDQFERIFFPFNYIVSSLRFNPTKYENHHYNKNILKPSKWDQRVQKHITIHMELLNKDVYEGNYT